ncbi:hypothetical protein PTKIN_Ptkin17bG0033900 [Pterospermum kingtungense]
MQGVEGISGVHILAIPFPAAGHILPHMDLIHQLLLRGITVTILVTPKNLHFLNPILSLHSPNNNVHTLLRPFPSHPSIPPGVENMAGLPLSFGPFFFSALTKLEDPLVQWFQTHPSPPVAIISDMILGLWVNNLASRLNIHNLSFMVYNANSTLSLTQQGLEKLSATKESFARNVFLQNLRSWGIIFNTFSELDGDQMKILKEEFSKHDRMWAVGPLPHIKANERGGPSSVPQDLVTAWLDSCHQDKSVVYVGFGTQIIFTKPQMEAVALALEESGVRFIWAVTEPKKDTKIGDDDDDDMDHNVVPQGFEERVGGRGLVIKGWTPQSAILEHRAVGSYLTHCGWNSALEGLLGRVLLLAWPMQADHYDNTKLLADELGVAIRVCEGLDTVPDATKLAKILSDSVNMERPERVRAMKLRQAAFVAIQKGGSSDKALDGLVETLSRIA